MKLCHGYGPTEGRCPYPAGGRRAAAHWCDACDRVRCATIDEQMQRVAREMREEARKR